MSRLLYNADSLTSGMREFEKGFGISSAEFYAAYLAEDEEVLAPVPQFERHVWASFCADAERLSPERAVMDRVSDSFAVPA
jgi:hypothetical protein